MRLYTFLKQSSALCCILSLVSALSAYPCQGFAEGAVVNQQGVSLFGELKYPSDFKKFDYVNATAPQGGAVTLASVGGFDTLNPFNGQGEAAPSIEQLFETLLKASLDEPSSEYGLLASTLRIAPDQTWVEFDLRPEAHWSDGKPLTADDVVFSFQTLKTKGAPYYRAYYASVKTVQALNKKTVRFDMDKAGNREIGLILGQLPILPKHFFEGKDFSTALTQSPIGSGSYKVESFTMNRRITYKKDPQYWGKDLSVNKGYNNFETLIYDVYRDQQVSFEAFKSGAHDFWVEGSAKNWATSYNFDAVKQGKVKQEIIPNKQPQGLQGFVFNLRRNQFQDRKVRQALMNTLDFEWMNQNLFFGQYKRTCSYFEGSELAATDLPTPEEKAILEPFKDKLPAEVFTTIYQPPSNAQGNDIRTRLREAQILLKEAGWSIQDGTLKDASGKPFTLEFLLNDVRFERVALPLVDQMKRLGIQATVRIIDSAQYTRRLQAFDYDIVVGSYGQSSSPGNEQREYWGSESAQRSGSKNLMGLKDPVVDALVEKLVHAQNRQELITVTRSLDRVLQWGYYTIPQWHFQGVRVAYWNKFGRPDPALSGYGFGFPSLWWSVQH
jgi:microcin C transport system substrate-binding protein